MNKVDNMNYALKIILAMFLFIIGGLSVKGYDKLSSSGTTQLQASPVHLAEIDTRLNDHIESAEKTFILNEKLVNQQFKTIATSMEEIKKAQERQNKTLTSIMQMFRTMIPNNQSVSIK